LLIIGYAGSGKSTLFNVLSNTDTVDFESSKKFRIQTFEWEGMKYRVVDDIGMGNIMLTNKEVMSEKMQEVMPEGISQVLFVIDGKFAAEEESMFSLLKHSIFENGISDYITIVRTKFSNFKNENVCENDKNDLRKKNETIYKLCKRIVYVDNPPINIVINDDDDEETITTNRKRRNESRIILLHHLNKVILEKYCKNWDKLFNKITVGNIGEKLNRSINLKNLEFNFSNLKVGVRNLIIVGRTNSGKSTLAEVLSDSHYSEESAGIEKKYHVTDYGTKSIKDIIKLPKEKRENCQILFVIDGKFMTDEVEAAFDNDIHEHITIVRTKFSNFKNENRCKKDKEDLCNQNKAFAKICPNIVYMDNSPINIQVKDEDDEATITLNKKRRDLSRTILLKHLNKVFQEKCDKKHNKTAVGNNTDEVVEQLDQMEHINHIQKIFTS
jgi:adenylate kinase family enzyme